MNLKRKYENNSCTHGILTIPAYGFKCLTLELGDGDSLTFKLDCRISEGNYMLVRGYAQNWPSFPVFKKKPHGFAKKPSFNLEVTDYTNLPTGDIGLGTSRASDFALSTSTELQEKFPEICREVFTSNEIVVLSVYRSKKFRKTTVETTTVMGNFDFIEEDFDDDEPTELEHDGEP